MSGGGAGEISDWVAEYADHLSTLAAQNDANLGTLATAGANAIWDAAIYRAPALLEPAKIALDRVTADSAVAVLGAAAHLDAKLASAFFVAHKDWAHGRDLDTASLAEVHAGLTGIMGNLVDAQPDSRRTAMFLLRATYMAQLTRTGDSSCIVFPAAPDIRTKGWRGRPPNNEFARIDGSLIPCNIESLKPPNPQYAPGRVNIFAGDALSAGVYVAHPEIAQTYAHLPPRLRRQKATEYVARLVLQEANQTIDETGKAFLDRSTAKTTAFLRNRVRYAMQ